MLGREDRDAMRTARYVDALLARSREGRDAVDADPSRKAGTYSGAGAPASAGLDPRLVRAARRLRADLVPVHPSFRFEEDLAARLASAARQLKAGRQVYAAAPDGGADAFAGRSVATQPPAPNSLAAESFAGSLEPAVVLAGPAVPAHRLVTPLLVGGMAASALSLGAVYVAWRFSHPGTSPAVAPGATTLASTGASLAATAASAASTTAVSAARSLHRGRRSAVLHGLLGVVS